MEGATIAYTYKGIEGLTLGASYVNLVDVILRWIMENS